jgi:hypothetical protein
VSCLAIGSGRPRITSARAPSLQAEKGHETPRNGAVAIELQFWIELRAAALETPTENVHARSRILSDGSTERMIAPSVEIRKATPADLKTALAVLEDAAVWASSTGHRAWDVGVFAWPRGRGVVRIRQWIDDGTLYLISADGIAAGAFALWDRDDMFWPNAADDGLYLHQFAVCRHARGVGRQAIRWMTDECRRRDRQFLRLDCMAENEGIRRYYEAEGFVLTDETIGYGIPLSLYEMRIADT